MTNDELKQAISQLCGEAVFKDGARYLEITLPAAQLHEVCLKLKNNADLAFDYLICLTGVDYPTNMEVVYHLESTQHHHTIVVKSKTADRENPALDSVCDIWPTAQPHEREIHDLLGIKFNNNPDLRRLFLEDGWGFPLRKDYYDPIRIVER